jgi:hypothetical protein
MKHRAVIKVCTSIGLTWGGRRLRVVGPGCSGSKAGMGLITQGMSEVIEEYLCLVLRQDAASCRDFGPVTGARIGSAGACVIPDKCLWFARAGSLPSALEVPTQG